MRTENLPSPGALSQSIRLRVEAAKAISSLEILNMRTPGGTFAYGGVRAVNPAVVLHAYFTACSAAITAIVAP